MTDGEYPVRLVEAKVFNDGGEDEFLELTWETMGDTRTTFTQNVPRKVNGVYNAYGANVVRLWATDWNMLSFAELAAHAAEYAATRPLIAVIKNDNLVVVKPGETEEVRSASCELGSDNSITPQPQPSTSTFQRPIRIKFVVDEERMANLPAEISPCMEEAWALFNYLTEQTPNHLDAEKVWIELARRIGPMQADFGEAEWAKMIESIRKMKTCEFTLKK